MLAISFLDNKDFFVNSYSYVSKTKNTLDNYAILHSITSKKVSIKKQYFLLVVKLQELKEKYQKS